MVLARTTPPPPPVHPARPLTPPTDNDLLMSQLPGDAATLLATSDAAGGGRPPIDQRQLAQQVYALIKQRLAIEVERAGLGPGRRR